MKAILEDFTHRCGDGACGGERVDGGLVKRFRLTSPRGWKTAFDTKEEAMESAKKRRFAVDDRTK